MGAAKKNKKAVKAAKKAKTQKQEAVVDDRWHLRLYVAGQTPRCVRAYEQLKLVCEEHLEGRYTIEVIDLLENPTLAAGDQIIAIPTLVRKLPTPMKRIIGDLSNNERVIVGLNLIAQSAR